ncbi:MAG: hypothetical protein QJR12_11465 [Mycobacterium sp.]|uniref:hypothetical protein n=1 Tax=Mycobacterium sp. TaxID=1785 RepID=UPI0026170B37|nr:hypothetical protein [Mycobacterium sp.]MDI3314856.1 hypothetical protein [Mycobacterium sp.]
MNMFTVVKNRGSLARATAGAGLALAALGVIGLGSGVAGASPQQPVLVDDPAPVAPNPAAGVSAANAIFGELDSLLNQVFPGLGPIFMPAASGANPLTPGSTGPLLPGQTPALPGQGPLLPGQNPASPGYLSPNTSVTTSPVV